MQQSIELAKSTGWSGLDLNLREASALVQEHDVDYVLSLWSDAGLQMGGCGFPVNVRGSDAEYDESLSNLLQLAKLAADLGCHRMTSGVPPCSDDLTFQENWDLHVKRIRPAAEILKDYGHSLGIEFIGPAMSRKSRKYLFTYSMDAVLGLAAAIGTGNVGLLFDVWHWYTCRATLDDVKKLSKADVVYVHINDAPAGVDPFDQIDTVRCLPAETGVIPITELMHILRDIGFDGPVTPEPFSKAINNMEPEDAAKATIASLNKVWEQAGLA